MNEIENNILAKMENQVTIKKVLWTTLEENIYISLSDNIKSYTMSFKNTDARHMAIYNNIVVFFNSGAYLLNGHIFNIQYDNDAILNINNHLNPDKIKFMFFYDDSVIKP